MDAYIEVAVATKPKGLKGEVHAHILEGFDAEVLNTKAVFANRGGQQVPYIIEEFAVSSETMVRLKLKGVDTKEKAEELRKVALLVPEQHADRYRHAEEKLLGYEVFGGDVRLGTVSELLSTTAQDLISVTTDSDEELLIPFVDDFITKQDDDGKKLWLNLPDGLVDINS